jgi:type II restriction enzyme
MCNPQRIDSYTGEILTNLKHIMWCPDEFHPIGEIVYKEYNEVITEVELEVSFGQVTITQEDLEGKFDSIAAKTIHTQMQIALIEIGNALDFRTWIAKNDRSIPVGNTTLGHLPGVLQSLNEVPILYTAKIKDAASLIDCIWFTKDGDRIPAIIEIEHTTGVTSGLTRMQKLHEVSPSITKNFTIVAPDNLRNKVVTEANQKIYRELKAKYMPYSTIRELYGLIQRYSLKGVAEHTFIYPFMEQIVAE